jgi:hypothetical protein
MKSRYSYATNSRELVANPYLTPLKGWGVADEAQNSRRIYAPIEATNSSLIR